MFSIPIMNFEKVSNGWKVAIDCYPFRAHYIKLETSAIGIRDTGWMLEHVECIREDMHEYLDLMQHMCQQEALI